MVTGNPSPIYTHPARFQCTQDKEAFVLSRCIKIQEICVVARKPRNMPRAIFFRAFLDCAYFYFRSKILHH